MSAEVLHRVVRLLRAVGLCLALSSCGSGVGKNDVAGSYVSKIPVGLERLTLLQNLTFAQEIDSGPAGPTFRAAGTWRFDVTQQSVLFDSNFLSSLDDRGRLKKEIRPIPGAFYSLDVGHRFRTLTLTASENHVFIKASK